MKRLTWLPFLSQDVPADLASPADVARFELEQAGVSAQLKIDPTLGEGWEIAGDTVTGGESGVLYGTYRFLMARAAGQPFPSGAQQPRYPLRMINCWDNAEGNIERGYSGRSLFFEGGKLDYDPARM